MTALDTNVLVRVLTNDDERQSQIAAAFMRRQDRLYVLKTVLLEIEWVLRSLYGFDREAISLGIRSLMRTPNFVFEDEDAVTQAMAWYDSGMDFADALHLSSTRRPVEFATFDRSMAQAAERLGIGRLVAL